MSPGRYRGSLAVSRERTASALPRRGGDIQTRRLTKNSSANLRALPLAAASDRRLAVAHECDMTIDDPENVSIPRALIQHTPELEQRVAIKQLDDQLDPLGESVGELVRRRVSKDTEQNGDGTIAWGELGAPRFFHVRPASPQNFLIQCFFTLTRPDSLLRVPLIGRPPVDVTHGCPPGNVVFSILNRRKPARAVTASAATNRQKHAVANGQRAPSPPAHAPASCAGVSSLSSGSPRA